LDIVIGDRLHAGDRLHTSGRLDAAEEAIDPKNHSAYSMRHPPHRGLEVCRSMRIARLLARIERRSPRGADPAAREARSALRPEPIIG